MAKTEDWLGDVWKGVAETITSYRHLTPRETLIVLAAANDAILTHLITSRLVDEKEVKNLFKTRAPLGDSSSRTRNHRAASW